MCVCTYMYILLLCIFMYMHVICARVWKRERERCVCMCVCLFQFTVCFAAKALSRLRLSCFQSWCWTASPTASYEPSCGNSQSQCVGSLNSRDFDQAVSKEAQKYCQVHSLHPHRHAPEHCSGIRGRPRVLALSNFKAPKLGLNLDPCWIQVP